MAFVTATHLIVCVLLILIVLLQHGKGADLGATFGGSGNTLFGASGADNLFTRLTTGLAVVFMTTSIVLASNITPEKDLSGTIFKDLPNAKPAPVAAASKKEDKQADDSNKKAETDADDKVIEDSQEQKEVSKSTTSDSSNKDVVRKDAEKAVAEAVANVPLEKIKKENNIIPVAVKPENAKTSSPATKEIEDSKIIKTVETAKEITKDNTQKELKEAAPLTKADKTAEESKPTERDRKSVV